MKLDVEKITNGSKQDQLKASLISPDDGSASDEHVIFSPKQVGDSRMYSSMASLDDLNQQLEKRDDLEQVEETNEV